MAVWITERIFSEDALHSLLHDPLPASSSASSSARSRRRGRGYSLVQLIDAARAFNSIAKTPLGGASDFVDVECIQSRGREGDDYSRWDARLTLTWVDVAKRSNAAFRTAARMADDVKALDPRRCAHAKVDWHVNMVMPGSKAQELHRDDDADERCYYTLIVPLVNNPHAGGTHFPALDRTFADFGAAVLFDGSVQHAGLANRSQQTRYFLYAAIYTGVDENCD